MCITGRYFTDLRVLLTSGLPSKPTVKSSNQQKKIWSYVFTRNQIMKLTIIIIIKNNYGDVMINHVSINHILHIQEKLKLYQPEMLLC